LTLFFDPSQHPAVRSLLEFANQPLDIIFVGAHPDDVEIACGGTIHRLVQQGYRVGIVDLTDGEPTPLCDEPAIRWAEAKAAAESLGVHYRRILNLPNRRLMDGFESRVALAMEFRIWRPKIVVGFGQKTPMASPDHFQAVQITDAAIFYSRLSKWEAYFNSLPTHTILRQLYFHLSFESSPTALLEPHLTVDISSSLETKLAAIACYQTQFPPEKGKIFERVKALAIAHGMAAGFDAGEIFGSPRPIGVPDLVKAMLP
jgi:N-acetylglucosamine malate deacetylase 1